MKIIHILKGTGNKPAYIEFMKEGSNRPTLLSVEKFRERYGEGVTDEALGVTSEIDTETLDQQSHVGEAERLGFAS